MRWLSLLVLTTGCSSSVEPAERTDADGDGYVEAEDCDDGDPDVHPFAPEQCDAIDSDCDGSVDDPEAEGSELWFLDADSDGFGDPGERLHTCESPEGYVQEGGDCDDTDPDVYPDAEEVLYDGIDQDCDGSDVLDLDGDGFEAVEAGGEDCDDEDPDVHPDAMELAGDAVDQDCDGGSDTPRLETDLGWSGPSGVAVAPIGRDWLLLAGAASVDWEGTEASDAVVAVALVEEESRDLVVLAEGEGAPGGVDAWAHLGGVLAAYAVGDDGTRVGARALEWDTRTLEAGHEGSVEGDLDAGGGVSLREVDDGSVWALGVGDGGASWVRVIADGRELEEGGGPVPGVTGFVGFDQQLWIDDGDGLAQYDADLDPAEEGRFSGIATTAIATHGVWTLLASADGGLLLDDGETTWTLVEELLASAVALTTGDLDGDGEDEVLIAAVAGDDTGGPDQIVLGWGDRTGPLDLVTFGLAVDGDAEAATDVAVGFADGTLLLAAAGESTVGWGRLAFP